MLRICIAAAALALTARAADPGPFSHKLHLELKIACADCHKAAAQSTKFTDNLLPTKEACVKCHEQVKIKDPAKTQLSAFNHALHAKLPVAKTIAQAIDTKEYLANNGAAIRKYLDTNIACVGCHRGLAESTPVTHANHPQMADCMVCHTQIDPPFSCEKCHSKEMKLRPENHVADFLDSHSSGTLKLDKTTCALCHGRRFQCQGCH